MAVKSRINIEIQMPVIHKNDSLTEGYTSYGVYQCQDDILICNNNYLKMIEDGEIFNEELIDCNGILYKVKYREKLSPVNSFWGIFLPNSGFLKYHINLYLQEIQLLNENELKQIATEILKEKDDFFYNTLLPIEKWYKELQNIEDRNDILRYLFYFADPGRYYTPDQNDVNWKQRKGIVPIP